MTRKQLENWHFLEIRADQLRDQIRELEGRALPKSPDWSGKARSTAPVTTLDRLVPDIIERQEVIGKRLDEVTAQLIEIEEFVAAIPDLQVRVIVFYRCRQLMKWNEIAEHIGGKNTEDSCKKIYYRFFDKNF